MKVLQWAFPLYSIRGGREVFTVNLSNALSKMGADILVASDPPSPSLNHDLGLESDSRFIDMVGSPSGTRITFPEILERIRQVVSDFRPNVIHCHNVSGLDSVALKIIAQHAGVPVVYTEHENLHNRNSSSLAQRKAMTPVLGAVVAPSAAAAAGLRAAIPEWNSRVHTIHNGVPITKSSLTPANPKQVFASGRSSPEKGFSVLLAAWALILPNQPDARLTLAGDGPRLPSYKALAEKLGITDSVEFPGWLTGQSLQGAIAQSSVVVAPSTWSEPFGLVAVEAGVASKPVIAARVGAFPEIIVHKRNGLLFEAGDIPELAAAINYLLGHPMQAKALGQTHREIVETNFSIEGCATQYLELYEKLSHPRPGEVA